MIRSLVFVALGVTFVVTTVAVLCALVSPVFFVLAPLGAVAVIGGGVRACERWEWL